jgi:hypothetical protein
MNRNASVARPHDDSWIGFFSHALLWLMLSAAGLMLAWFMAVLEDVTQRGEQRRVQQRLTGSLLLSDELKARAGSGDRVISVASDTAAVR